MTYDDLWWLLMTADDLSDVFWWLLMRWSLMTLDDLRWPLRTSDDDLFPPGAHRAWSRGAAASFKKSIARQCASSKSIAAWRLEVYWATLAHARRVARRSRAHTVALYARQASVPHATRACCPSTCASTCPRGRKCRSRRCRSSRLPKIATGVACIRSAPATNLTDGLKEECPCENWLKIWKLSGSGDGAPLRNRKLRSHQYHREYT